MESERDGRIEMYQIGRLAYGDGVCRVLQVSDTVHNRKSSEGIERQARILSHEESRSSRCGTQSGVVPGRTPILAGAYPDASGQVIITPDRDPVRQNGINRHGGLRLSARARDHAHVAKGAWGRE